MALRGIARQVAGAKQSGAGGNYINPGKGVLVVAAMKDGNKPEFFNGETSLCEFIVESCTGFAGCKKKDGTEKPAGNQVGSSCTYLEQYVGAWPDLARGRFKDFLMQLFDETEASLQQGAELVTKTVAEGKSLPGMFGEFVCKEAKEVIAKGEKWDAQYQYAAIYEFCMADRSANRARGMRIRYTTIEKETGDGELITVPKWEPIQQTDEQIAAVRSGMDAAGAPKT